MTKENTVGRLLREPLIQFAALAVLVFVLEIALGKEAMPPESAAGPTGPIRVDVEDHRRLDREFEERYERPPTDAEHQALVDGAVEHELVIREAFALGLVGEDPMVRRRLLDKMEFVLGQASGAAPHDGDLEAFYAENAARYAPAPRYDFVAVRVKAADGPAPAQFAAQVRQDLLAGVDPKTLGDRTLESKRFTPARVTQMYGAVFTEALFLLEEGAWSLVDADGTWYVVKLKAIEARGEVPPLHDVRDQVERDWQASERTRAFLDALEELRDKYEVEIEARP